MGNYHLLDIEVDSNGYKQVITPVLIQDEEDTLLVDCGYPGFIPLLEAAANKKETSLDKISKIIVTHHDIDHIGSLAALKQAYPHIHIIAHEQEAPYIDGTRPSLRAMQAESSFDSLPDEQKPQAEQFIRLLKAVEPAHVDQTVVHGERLPWGGGIEIVHTPGHMPGHISIYLPSSKALIAADAVVIEEGKLNIANPDYALDLEEAVRSMERLMEYDIEQLICYHGGLYTGDARQGLKELVEAYRC